MHAHTIIYDVTQQSKDGQKYVKLGHKVTDLSLQYISIKVVSNEKRMFNSEKFSRFQGSKIDIKF